MLREPSLSTADQLKRDVDSENEIGVASRGGVGGRGERGLKFPLPITSNPGFHPIFVGSCLFALFRLQNIEQFCVLPLYPPLTATLRIPLPAPSTPASRLPPAPFSNKWAMRTKV